MATLAPETDATPVTAWDSYADMIDLDAATQLTDHWAPDTGAGYRFYHLTGGVGDHDPMYALTRYDRDVDDQTGDMVETEGVLQLGTLNLGPVIALPDADDDTILAAGFDGGFLQMDIQRAISTVADRMTATAADRVADHDVIGVEGDTLLVGVTKADELDALAAATDITGIDADVFDRLWDGIRDACDAITDVADSETDYDHLYRVPFALEQPEMEWRMRAVEYQHHGVFPTQPALAAVKALYHDTQHTTQKEVAEILGTDTSTVSQQAAAVDDWLDRAEWMVDHA